jgi:hypothetical protein
MRKRNDGQSSNQTEASLFSFATVAIGILINYLIHDISGLDLLILARLLDYHVAIVAIA